MSELQTTNWNETAASNTATPPDGAPEGHAPDKVNDIIRELMAALKRDFNRIHGLDNSGALVSSAGTSTAYTVSYTTAPASLFTGLLFGFKVHTDCGADPTVNVNALGAKNMQKPTSSGLANLASGDLKTGQFALCRYDATLDKVIVLSHLPAATTTSANTFTAAQTFSAASNLFKRTNDSGGNDSEEIENSSTANNTTKNVTLPIAYGRDTVDTRKQVGYARWAPRDANWVGSQFEIAARASDTVGVKVTVRDGVQVGNPTGGDQGAGTQNNAADYFYNGAALPRGIAAQSDQETGTSTVLAVTPGRQHFHPGHPKAWVQAQTSGGVPSILAQYGVSSITDSGTGTFDINWLTAFSTANYFVAESSSEISTNEVYRASDTNAAARSTTSTRLLYRNSSAALADPPRFGCAAFGDQ